MNSDNPYPPTCHGCQGQMQPMAHGPANEDGSRKIALVCETCDGPTLETMWGALGSGLVEGAGDE